MTISRLSLVAALLLSFFTAGVANADTVKGKVRISGSDSHWGHGDAKVKGKVKFSRDSDWDDSKAKTKIKIDTDNDDSHKKLDVKIKTDTDD